MFRKQRLLLVEILPLRNTRRKDATQMLLLDFSKGKEYFGTIIYEYEDLSGRKNKGIDYVAEDIFNKYQVGDEIKIYYDPKKTHLSITAESLEKRTGQKPRISY